MGTSLGWMMCGASLPSRKVSPKSNQYNLVLQPWVNRHRRVLYALIFTAIDVSIFKSLCKMVKLLFDMKQDCGTEKVLQSTPTNQNLLLPLVEERLGRSIEA